MDVTHLKAAIVANADGILASTASVGATVGLASGVAPVPDGVPAWLPYAVSTLAPLAIYVAKRLLDARAARKEARAAVLAARAKALLADGDPENDLQAAALELEAAEERAEAAALRRSVP
jgi:hypothetical protein